MKKLILVLAMYVSSFNSFAQLATPLFSEFSFTSTPQSWVGHGLSQDLAGVTAQPRGSGALFSTTGGWIIIVEGVNGAALSVGDYPSATRFGTATTAGLDFFGNGRGNNQLTGAFTVKEFTYGPSEFGQPPQITSAAIDFIQYDEGIQSWRNDGSLRFNSTLPVSGMPITVPEPSTITLLALSIVVCGLQRLRSKK